MLLLRMKKMMVVVEIKGSDINSGVDETPRYQNIANNRNGGSAGYLQIEHMHKRFVDEKVPHDMNPSRNSSL